MPDYTLRRRKYPLGFKLQMLREIAAPGASVTRVARRHNVNSNAIFRWRREYQAGEPEPAALEDRSAG
jgi:transposase